MDWSGLSSAIQSSNKGEPLYAQITNYFVDCIANGQLKAGSRMPTNRELSSILSVDRSTVSRAYSELMERGLIDSRVGRGTFVRATSSREKPSHPQTSSGIVWSERFSRASRTTTDIMDSQPVPSRLAPDMVSFAGGLPTEEFYPSTELRKMVADILGSSQAEKLFEYSPAEGFAPLRQQVLKHLKDQGIEADDDELLIVSGSQQAIDLVTNVLVDPGDAVILEDPSYFWAICNFRSHQARCVSVPVDVQGMDMQTLERELERNNAKLIYVMPSFQNPTGAELSLERRERLVALARRYGVPILEDNFVGDLRYDGQALPSLRALPGGREIVIHQGTFSKALCPGLRLGWIVAPRELLARLLLAKRISDLSTNSMAQLTLSHYLSAGLYVQHLDRVRSAYKSRRDAMIAALSRWFPSDIGKWAVTWNKPNGGLFIWCRLPSGMSAREFLKFAEKENVTFSPGDLFFLSGERREFLRLCFIQTNEALITDGIERLAKAYEKYSQSFNQSKTSSQDVFARTRENVLI